MSDQGSTPNLTAEQIAAMRLEGIFMPHARSQRDKIYQNQEKPTRFVHYTSAEAALKIIRSKRIWMRNTNCMTDYREVQHGFDSLNSFFLDPTKRNAFTQALEACSPGSAQEAINLFNGWLPDIRLNTYIASLSEHDDSEDLHGRLSMWRAFGGNIARVAVVLKIPPFSDGATALNVIFSPVAYLNQPEVHTVLDTVTKNIIENRNFLQSINRPELIGYIFLMLVAGVACLKHEGFREEREWRAIYSPNRASSQFMESSTEIIGGVPQIVHQLPLDATKSQSIAELDLASMFDRLIIGPSPYPWVMYTAFVEALTATGVSNARDKVLASGIPIRT